MFSGDLTQWDAEIAIFAASDDGHVADNGKAPSFSIGPKHNKHNLHGRVSLKGVFLPQCVTVVVKGDLGNK
jgi:hypothetical protein